jgi:hypothetical protein
MERGRKVHDGRKLAQAGALAHRVTCPCARYDGVGLGMANVKGSAIESRVLWVRLHHGEEGVVRLCERLSPAARAVVLEPPHKASWYPFPVFVELNETIDQVFGKGDLSIVTELGRHGADANLTTVYRLFYMVGTPKWILDRASRLWDLHYDSGRLTVVRYPGNEIEVHIRDFATPHITHCLSVYGWCWRSLELSGAKDIHGEEVSCRTRGDAECVFHATWK